MCLYTGETIILEMAASNVYMYDREKKLRDHLADILFDAYGLPDAYKIVAPKATQMTLNEE